MYTGDLKTEPLEKVNYLIWIKKLYLKNLNNE